MSCALAESFLRLGYREDKEEVIRIFIYLTVRSQQQKQLKSL